MGGGGGDLIFDCQYDGRRPQNRRNVADSRDIPGLLSKKDLKGVKPQLKRFITIGETGAKLSTFFEIIFSCFYGWIYLIAFKCIIHCQVLATT